MRHIKWIAVVLLLVVLISGYAAYPKIHAQLGLAADSDAQVINAASPAQLAAIQGAQQLLLLQPLQTRLYLPFATR